MNYNDNGEQRDDGLVETERLTNPNDPLEVYQNSMILNDDACLFDKRPLLQSMTQRKHLLARISFSVLFLLALGLANITLEKTRYILTPDQCMLDYTFEWTAWANTFLANHVMLKCTYMCFGALLMDVSMICMLTMFYLYWKTTRVCLAIPLMFLVRGII